MIAPWFTAETYALMPGLIIGLSGGLYGVLIGLLYESKNIEQYFKIISFIMILICIGSIIFGVVASFYDQPESAVYDFIGVGVIGLIIFSVLCRVIGRHLSNMSSNTQDIEELIKSRSSSPNDEIETKRNQNDGSS
jgi:DMSO reductase anchor subunit